MKIKKFAVLFLAALAGCATVKTQSNFDVANQSHESLQLTVSNCLSKKVIISKKIIPGTALQFKDMDGCMNIEATTLNGKIYARISKVIFPPSFHWTIK